MAPTDVFLDSSVLFAALLSKKGAAREMVEYGRNGQLVLKVSQVVLMEVRRNLQRKAPQALPELEATLTADILEIVNPPNTLVDDIAKSFERKDAPIIAGAVAGNCTFLATYDRLHLLSQTDRILDSHGIVTTTPSDILETLRPAP